MDKLKDAAMIALRDCMAVKKAETVLIITDEPKRKIGYVLWETACELGAEAMLVEIIPRRTNGEEPPAAIAEMMKYVDVILAPTSKSLSHTDARRNASQAGARIATLPGITEEMMVRCLNADYKKIAQRSIKLAAILTEGKTACVMTPAGTNITMSIEGRIADPDTGFVHKPGDFCNLPAGEAYLAPVEGTANGIIVVDGAMAGVGMIKDKPIRMLVKDGYAVEISGGGEAVRLQELIEPFGQPARNIAELGIGTNNKAILTGIILEDEKVMGTVHIAIGDNVSFGGKVHVPSHLDGLLKQPTLQIDGQVIMRDGQLLV
jgi:leucyl aminopeptidase (aminopeptidase T)